MARIERGPTFCVQNPGGAGARRAAIDSGFYKRNAARPGAAAAGVLRIAGRVLHVVGGVSHGFCSVDSLCHLSRNSFLPTELIVQRRSAERLKG